MLSMKQFGLHTKESKMVITVSHFSITHFQKKKTKMNRDLFGKSDTNAYFLTLKGGNQMESSVSEKKYLGI